jgi:hypothetical protein
LRVVSVHNAARKAPVIAAVIATAALVFACGGPPGTPEQALSDWLTRAELAAEEKNRAALTGMISGAYADARGNDRAAIDRLLRLYFLRQREVALLTRIDDIRLQGSSAAFMTVSVGMAGTNSGTFGLTADAYRFEFELEADGDEWLLIGARWGEIGRELR